MERARAPSDVGIHRIDRALCALVSFVWYPSSLPISYSWNALYAIVWHVWDDLSYWLVCVLVLSLILLPRFLGRAWELLFATDASTCSTRMSTPTVVAAERASRRRVPRRRRRQRRRAQPSARPAP